MSSHAPILLRAEDLAKRLHKSVASIRSDVWRNPAALPPVCRLPGTKRLLWREEDVDQWLARHVVGSPGIESTMGELPLRSRGRPTKAEQVRRRTKAGGAR